MRHRIQTGLAVMVAVIAVAVCLAPGIAYASLDSWPSPVGTTSTNPNPPMDDASYREFWWRLGWGKSLKPQLSWNEPEGFDSNTEGAILGQLYRVDRDPTTMIDSSTTSTVSLYSRSTFGNTKGEPYGTNFDATYNLRDIYEGRVGSWPATVAGVADPIEGVWWVHAKYYSTLRYSGLTMHVPLKIDVTPPRPVSGLIVSTDATKAAATSWVPATRAHIRWTPDAYDSLSGVGYYEFLVDGVSVDTTAQGRVYEAPWLPTPSSWTIEDMPPGKHKISVVTVDRATNRSTTSSSVYFYSDPDTPTVTFGSFSRTVSTRPTFSVVTSDAAGIRQVVYRLDGTLLGTKTSSPFSISPNLSGFSAGNHTLTATASDYLGRAVSVSTTIKLDKTPLSITSFSRTPSIFYPIKRDGFGDYSTVKFKLNKPATIKWTIKTSKGSTIRTITKSFGSGSHSMKWDGKWSKDKKAHTGTFKYKLSGSDSVGYTDSTGTLSTKIRDYQLKRTGGGSVKVISR